jgi:DNA polymerase-3 subunit epsilon
MGVIRCSLDQSGLPYPVTDYFCTKVIAKLAWPDHPTYALDYIARTLGISFRHHDAEEDAHACALVAIAACKQLNTTSLHELKPSCGLRVGQLFDSGYHPCGAPRKVRTKIRPPSEPIK